MHHHKPQSAFDRDRILQTLWEDPLLRVGDGAPLLRLNRGDEYVDMQQLGAGVQVATRCMMPSGGELARKTMTATTWTKLLVFLDV